MQNLPDVIRPSASTKVVVTPPICSKWESSIDDSLEERFWAVMLVDDCTEVILAWHRTRGGARSHAKRVKEALQVK